MSESGGPHRTRQQERTERSTNALLTAASDLIVEGGLDSLTFATIGERAGYSRGLVTARFGNKEGLIEALIDRILATWSRREAGPASETEPGRAEVIRLLEASRAKTESDRAGLMVLHALMFEAGSDPMLRRRFADYHESMRTVFETAVRRGKRDGSIAAGTNPRREGALIVAALQGIAYQWQLDGDRFDPADALRYLIATTEARLRP
ncbi:MAG: TetR/AcrR family transcriptional regulator [Actinomycetota bacterium]